MKKILLLISIVTVYFNCNGQQLYQGIYTNAALISDSAHGTTNPCYDYEINFSNLFVPTGMNLYIKIDSISGNNDSIEIYRYPDYINTIVHVKDTIKLNPYSGTMYFYFLSNSTLYYSMIEAGTPQILGENYFCSFNEVLGAVCDDPCIGSFIEYFGGNGQLDTTKSCSVITNFVNIKENISNNHIFVYPNPATDNLTIEAYTISIIQIINIHGQTLLQQQIQQGKTNIDVSGLAKGVYILKSSNNESTGVTRFTKE